MLGKLLKGKSGARFEVHFFQDKRWVIDMILPEEEEAVARARQLLQENEQVERVKVVRHKPGDAGLDRESEVFAEEAPEREKAYKLGGGGEAAPFCEKPEDFMGLAARMSLTRMLRAFLEDMGILTTELLHSGTWIRKLADSGSLMGAALYQVGSQQAEAAGVPPAHRVAALEKMVRQWKSWGQDFSVERKELPKFDPAGIANCAQRVRARMGAEAEQRGLRFLLCQHLANDNGAEAKLRRVLDMAEAAKSAPMLHPLIDEIAADALMFPDTIRGLFGRQPGLGAFLMDMGDFLHNRLPAGKTGIDPALHVVGGLIAGGHAPQCRAVLADRALRELASDSPLDKRDPENELALLKTVAGHLTGKDGAMLGGETGTALVERRKLRLRQAQLRAMGMHDAADALGG